MKSKLPNFQDPRYSNMKNPQDNIDALKIWQALNEPVIEVIASTAILCGKPPVYALEDFLLQRFPSIFSKTDKNFEMKKFNLFKQVVGAMLREILERKKKYKLKSYRNPIKGKIFSFGAKYELA